MQMIRVLARCGRFRPKINAFALAMVMAVGAIHTSPSAQASETAQKLLFDTPYLQQLKLPSSLNYTYRHDAAETRLFGKPFTDTIAVDLSKPSNPAHVNSVSMRIFTGERARSLGPNVDMKGNPIIMIFLERDLWEMKRRVGGEPIFYRNKIRKALREQAKVEKIQIDFEGKSVPAHKVTIKPFVTETTNRRLEKYLNKSYEFVVADAVPGGFVSVRSEVPQAKASAKALVEDELTFLSAK